MQPVRTVLTSTSSRRISKFFPSSRQMTTPGGDRPVAKGVLVVSGFSVALMLAVAQGRGQHIGDDFAVFWQAGRSFVAGQPLYHDFPPGARQFKYPPFAALVFVPLGLLPLPVAAVLFSLLNLLLWVTAAYLTQRIVDRCLPVGAPRVLPFLLAIVFSAQFWLDNFHHVQMNGVIFLLILLGLDAYLRQRDDTGAGYLVAATAIKLTPIFFLAWLAIRGRRRAMLAVPAFALTCVALPLLARGPTTGAADLVDYYRSFLEPQRRAGLDQYAAGQNLAALVTRMTRPVRDGAGHSYQYLPASEPAARLVYEGSWLLVFGAFLLKLVSLRRRDAPLSALELSMVFLASLLLSPITFTHHLVSLLFVFYTCLVAGISALWPRHRIIVLALAGVMGFIGLAGRDLVGSSLYLSIRGYSLIAWMMLLLFGAIVVDRRAERAERAVVDNEAPPHSRR
jgi:glycosyl transferase family 87